MQIKAKLSNLRISARKVRLVADLIRGKQVAQAKNILNFTTKKATRPMLKLLNSAIANAKNNFKLPDSANLYIAKIEVNEGRKLKRSRPRARGQAYPIQKKTSHIIMILDERKKEIKSRPARKAQAAGQTKKHGS